ncbi:acetoin utilization protein AcuC [Ectobacillus sp. SYSU M60031]|uniref:Acetoin utilization protein AcuC n=2 Tax=Ectobacillus ponti TaxID=2961894 RepID=A0AA41X208_9BACI|nr:acetoin utilization protein AcuC [Ectobacillus ponti]MCP8967476.1 acetoin utilization protein AcuC [Ectobacillus ponti]
MKNVFIYSDAFQGYRFSPEHPFNHLRVKLSFDLLQKGGFLREEDIRLPRMATDEEIALIHDWEYIDAVKRAGEGTLSKQEGMQFGLGTDDTPMFEGMHEASALLVGGTLTAVDYVLEGKAEHALNLGGGLHHGFSRKASGFCIYNDSSIAIKYIQKKYGLRVMYVDTDAHHGDGVQWSFYDDPNVCTVSIHETGRYLFPGTGAVNERGQGAGFGYSFNVPLDAFTEDESFLYAYRTLMQEVAAYFKPDVILTQNGADAHYHDPLTHLCSTIDIYREIPKIAHEIAHQYCNGRWIAVGGGGYDMWRVVPRAWSRVWLEMTGNRDVSGYLPPDWIEAWKGQAPVPLPLTWEDPPDMYQPIPRKKEIEEKNYLSLTKSLEIIRNNMKNLML